MLRDTYPGELRAADVGREVRLAGWVARRRDHGGLIFIDLRDRSGMVQLVIDPAHAPEAHALAEQVRPENVLSATGMVVARSPETVNPKLPTGEVEVHIVGLTILNRAKTPPFEVEAAEQVDVDETLRLKYRYLDLRRAPMLANLELRHAVAQAARTYLNAKRFMEVETPILTKSTPEGARDFLVPAGCSPASSTRCRSRRSCSSRSSWSPASTATTRSRAASATRTCAPTGSPSTRRSTSRCRFVDAETTSCELLEGLLHEAIFEAGRLRRHAAARACRTTRRCCATARTSPTCASGSRSSDARRALRAPASSRSSGAVDAGGVVRGIRAPGGGYSPGPRSTSSTELAKERGAKGLAWRLRRAAARCAAPSSNSSPRPSRPALVDAGSTAEPGDLIVLRRRRARVAAEVLGALRLELIGRLALEPSGRWSLALGRATSRCSSATRERAR